MSNKTYSFLCPECGGEKLSIVGDLTVIYDTAAILSTSSGMTIKRDATMRISPEEYEHLFYMCDKCGQTWEMEDNMIADRAIVNKYGYAVDDDGKIIPTGDDYEDEEKDSLEGEDAI